MTLEKHVPKKGKEIVDEDCKSLYVLRCPVCGTKIGDGNKRVGYLIKTHRCMKYCDQCGQAIDRGEYDG